MLLASLATFFFVKWTDGRKAALEAFRRDHLFKIEFALSHGEYEQAKEALRHSLQNPEYKLAHPQIQMLEEVVLAAEKGR